MEQNRDMDFSPAHMGEQLAAYGTLTGTNNGAANALMFLRVALLHNPDREPLEVLETLEKSFVEALAAQQATEQPRD